MSLSSLGYVNLERLQPNNSLQPTSPSSLRSSCAAAELHR